MLKNSSIGGAESPFEKVSFNATITTKPDS